MSCQRNRICSFWYISVSKTQKIMIENCRGMSTIDCMLRTNNCPVLREVSLNNIKLLEPNMIENIFWNCYEMRSLTLTFLHNDCTDIFNKALSNIVTKIMRLYARFLPLPLWIFSNIEVFRISDIDEESTELFKKILTIDYDVYTKFKLYEQRSGRRLL